MKDLQIQNVNSDAGINNPRGTIGTIPFHDTQGKIEVNGGGQLQYTLPIALPPGIKSVAPQINLVYTSGSGNGIAGYGWNISGITAISRMGKTLEKDGEIKGVQLDYSDFYQFNGQRLILKSGEYGKDGAEYVTEKYSNIKIKSVGTNSGMNGPRYFEVTFEDGSQAWYGQVADNAARTPMDYNIVKWKDAQGNYISYNYIQNNNVAVISRIDWGGNETNGSSHFNSIVFNYQERDLKETSYVNGKKFVQSNLLSSIVVNSNGGQFKKYVINYKYNSDNKYQFVQSVQEFNALDEGANPVTFSYEDPAVETWKESRIKEVGNSLYGDFNGDGKMDLLMQENYEDLYLYKDVFSANPTKVFLGKVIDFSQGNATFTIKNSNNEVLPRQGFVVISGKSNGTSGEFATYDMYITGYSITPDTNQLIKEFEKVLPSDMYDRTKGLSESDKALLECWDEPRPGSSCPTQGTFRMRTVKTNIIAGSKEIDVNGDGQSELLIALNDTITETTITIVRPGEFPDRKDVVREIKRYLVLHPYDDDLSTRSSSFWYSEKSFFKENIQGDFNGDGVVDFMTLSNNPYISTFKPQPNGRYELVNEAFFNNGELLEGLVEHAVAGDFNGDGKTDLLVPMADKSSDWILYKSNGKSFEKEYKPGLTYFSKEQEITDQGEDSAWGDIDKCFYRTITYYRYAADDLDGDGKAEFIASKVVIVDHDWDIAHGNRESTRLFVDIYSTTNSTSTTTDFTKHETKDFYYQGKVIPFSLTSLYRNGKKVIFLGKPKNYGNPGDESSFVFLESNGFKDITKYSRINAITQGGFTTEIDYKELDPNINPGFYAETKKEKFPYVELDKISDSYAVSQLRQEGRKQDFKYRGFVAHLQGEGMIGFRQSARSSWYGDGYENTKIWSGAEIDPLNEGIPVKEWTVRTLGDDNLIFPADLSVNNNQLLSFKSIEYNVEAPVVGVKAIVPKKTVSKDFLKNIVEENSIIYSEYYLPKETTTKINGDFAITTSLMDYTHNPNGIGKNYFIGRPQFKTETGTAYNDTKSAKEEYIYENDLLKTLKTYNRDNSGWMQESYNYDDFGNIIEKNISNSADTMVQNEKFQYEPKGRFVVKKTDNLGLETNILYNDWGQITKQTDPLGITLENTYDGWGKLETSKTNLEGMSTYTYEKLIDGSNIVTEYAPDGTPKETYTNKLGQQYKVRARSFNAGSFASVSTVYDNLGRKVNESEPYFDNETPKWNSVSYDDSVFPAIATATAFNGKKMKTSVLGNVTTVEELNGNKRITKKTTDALGNVISSEDKGGVINFSYNAAGEQIKAQYGDNLVTTKYDVWSRKSEFFDPSNGLYKYEYNGSGQIKKEISPRGYKEYFYNDKGQLVNEVEKSNTVGLTDKSIAFTYNSKGQLESKTGTSNGKSYSSAISYDAFGRVKENIEQSNGKVFSQKNIVYDDKSRVSSYEKELISGGATTKVAIENIYDIWSGELYQVKDIATGKVLWQLQEANAKGLVLKACLGETNIVNAYDANNFLSETQHSSVKGQVFGSLYTFDAIKNELKERTRQGNFAMKEEFTYDDNNRLIKWINPKTGGVSSNKYDQQGRIIDNDQVGTIQFGDTTKVYQPTGAKLNTTGKQNYLNAKIQRIIYNENNDPLYIQSKKGDVRFEYGLTNMRQMVTFGQAMPEGNNGAIEDFATSDWEGTFTKHYSEDGSFEVVRNNTTGEEKHILYIGGTPYESNLVYLKDFTQSSGSYKFLHKDYLGSILAVSDEEGNLVEEAHFDAWGQLVRGGVSLINRGFTSHEHFEDIGIIHMNGRLYDPLLRRFLNADENIQDPNNTQNYNKYGYVLNNPLMYNDPNGEFLFFAALAAWIGSKLLAAAIIGALIGLASYSLMTAISGQAWNIGGALTSLFFGAIGGAVTFGIGSIFSNTAGTLTTFASSIKNAIGGVGLAIVQAGTHAISQGVLALVQGGDFAQSFSAGALGSLGASSFSAIAGDFASSAIGAIAFGALAGGIGAELSGGNFWQGAFIGGVVAGLNHSAHKDYGPKPKPKVSKKQPSLIEKFKQKAKEIKGIIQRRLIVESEIYVDGGPQVELEAKPMGLKVGVAVEDRHTEKLGLQASYENGKFNSHVLMGEQSDNSFSMGVGIIGYEEVYSAKMFNKVSEATWSVGPIGIKQNFKTGENSIRWTPFQTKIALILGFSSKFELGWKL
ncbi:RHS repeat-associated core domain-containing protein [Elizabethkingia anophelis]|uniref:RHS repeat-associated core domain-containing protein n=1 Tax=Elizabethkingia anophelis TaxID=1117645 RepID=UPI00301C8DD0